MPGSIRTFPFVILFACAAGCGGGSDAQNGAIALACPALIAPWTPGVTYRVGDLVGTLVGDGDSLAGLYMTDHRHRPPLPPGARRDDAPFAEARRAERIASERRDMSDSRIGE